MGYRLGIDIGGTFTDFVLLTGEGKIITAKTSSTPGKADFIGKGLQGLSDELGVTVRELLKQTEVIIQGTTIAANTVVQQRWSNTWLMCTEGFRDTLEARLGVKAKRYDYSYRPPPPIVPRYKRLPVRERVMADGQVYTPLHTEDVLRNIEKMRNGGAEACAVCFLHSYANPEHEKKVGEIIQRELPEIAVSLSSQVLPLHREYRRVSTTVLNVSLKATVTRYIERLEETLGSLGYIGEIRYIQSNGGLASGETIRDMPVLFLISGPAIGPQAGHFFASQFSYDTAVVCDMGGTSFDVSFVREGRIPMVKDIDVCGYRTYFPMVDVTTLGAGGGTIAWIDASGRLRVGPQSAEAVPGPACYPGGGEEPTVTDANLCLGLFPEELAGVNLRLDKSRAKEVIQEKIGSPLGMNVYEAARGILEIVNNNMVNSCREITIGRGYDVRDAVLVAGGGCTAAHAHDIAEGLGVHQVVIPKIASLLCSFGGVVADFKHDYLRTYLAELKKTSVDLLNLMYEEMEAKAYADLEREKISRENIDIVRTMDIRYEGELGECTVNVPRGKIESETLSEIEKLFHKEHERLYTFRDTVSPCKIINLGVVGYGRVAKPSITKVPRGDKDPSKAEKEPRLAFFAGYKDGIETKVYDGDRLRCGNIVRGPAIVEEATTTIVVPPGSILELSEYEAYLLELD